MYERNFNPYAANAEIVKGYFRSGKVLVLGILYLLGLGLSAALVFFNPVTASIGQAQTILDSMGINSFDLSAYYSLSSTALSTSVIISLSVSSLIIFLTALAFFLIFFKSRSSDPDSTPAAGLGILHTLAVISFVFTIIAVILIILVYVLLVIANSRVPESAASTVATIMIVSGICLSIIISLMLSIVSSQKNFYRSAKWSLSSVNLHTTGAVAYGVFNILFAVFGALAIVGSVVNVLSASTLGNILLLASAVISFLIEIFTASLALGYNSYIKREKLSYNTPYGGDRGGRRGRSFDPDDDYDPEPYSAPRRGSRDDFPAYNMPRQNEPPYDNGYNAPRQSTPVRNNGYNAPQSAPVPNNSYSAPAVKAEPAVCPNCGAPKHGTSPFCTNCGAKF